MKMRIFIYALFFLMIVFTGSVFAGSENTYNTFYGIGAGNSATPDSTLYDTFYGSGAGYSNTIGYSNTFLGYQAGYSNTTGFWNTFVGDQTGSKNTTGQSNIFLGSYAGANNTTGNDNTFIGYYAGGQNTLGNYNTFLGFYAGISNNIGNDNTFLGFFAGWQNTTGNDNTFMGDRAGYYNTTGNGNIFLGRSAGYNETGSNRLYIANSETATPLIYGEFDNSTLSVHGNLGVGTKAPVRRLHIVGDNAVFRMDRPYDTAAFMLVRTDGSGNPMKTFVVGTNASASNTGEFVINDLGTAVSGAGNRRMTIDNSGGVNFPGAVTAASFTPVSSIAHKTNVKTYENALETVKKLRGVSFDWKDSGKPSVGLIAEEVDQVIPEVVAHNDKDATGVNYDSLVGVLVEAVKEQEVKHQTELKAQEARHQAELEEQQKINAEHSREIAELKRLLILSNSVSKAD